MKHNRILQELLSIMNSLPGIETFCTDENHNMIWFKVDDPKGIFILTRCTDKRYWKYGDKWRIELSIGDQFQNNYLPTHYCLRPNLYHKENLDTEIISLIDNINKHLNHESFITGFRLNSVKNHIRKYNRKLKLNKIWIK